MAEYQDTEEAKIYQAKLKRADDLFFYAIQNPAWEYVAWDAEEDVAIYAHENEERIFK